MQQYFLSGEDEESYTYNNLKESINSTLLNSQNLNVSEEEYQKLIPSLIDKNKKMVALTFDDGPHSKNTDDILNILSKYNAYATFLCQVQMQKNIQML